MREFHITVSETRNPAILKFETNHMLTKGQNHEFANIDEAGNSPLARQLFHLPFIKTVYISGNFIALERFDIVEWADVKDEVAQQLVEYLNAGEPVLLEEKTDKLAITVYAEITPNPSVMKFVANKKIVPGAFEFRNIDEAKDSDLARQLFHFPFVKQVFFDENYVSVTKYDMAEWQEITMELREFIREFLVQGKQVVFSAAPSASTFKETKTPTVGQPGHLDETSQQIVAILEEYVKPAVASDGGNILFQSYEKDSKTVNVVLQGACSGCPSSTFTLKNGIETMLKNMMGDKVNEVVALNG